MTFREVIKVEGAKFVRWLKKAPKNIMFFAVGVLVVVFLLFGTGAKGQEAPTYPTDAAEKLQVHYADEAPDGYTYVYGPETACLSINEMKAYREEYQLIVYAVAHQDHEDRDVYPHEAGPVYVLKSVPNPDYMEAWVDAEGYEAGNHDIPAFCIRSYRFKTPEGEAL